MDAFEEYRLSAAAARGTRARVFMHRESSRASFLYFLQNNPTASPIRLRIFARSAPLLFRERRAPSSPTTRAIIDT